MIQETHAKDPPADANWRGDLFYEPGDGNRTGCMMLIKPTAALGDLHRVDLTAVAAARGRVLRVDGTLAGRRISLVTVYAPADAAERVAFFEEALPQCLPEPGSRAVIMGGDFNCITDVADYHGDAARGAERAAEAGARALLDLMRPPAPVHADGADDVAVPWLVDAWRELHPLDRDVTHISRAHTTAARLDRWLVSADLLPQVAGCAVDGIHPVTTDHLPVTLTVTAAQPVLRGNAHSHVPGDLFDVPAAKGRISSVIAAYVALAAAQPPNAGPTFCMDLWTRMKRHVRAEATVIIQQRRGAARAQQAHWEAAAAAARRRYLLLPADAPVPQRRAAVDDALLTASVAVATYDAQATRRLEVGEVLAHQYDHRGTRYFFCKSKPPLPPVLVPTLRLDPGPVALDLSTRTGTMAALHDFARHYSAGNPAGVYAERPHDPHARQQLLAAVTVKLSAGQALLAEGPAGTGHIAVEELRHALARTARDTSPGEDGLPVEFYLHFWGALGPLLTAAANEAFDRVDDDAPLQDLLLGVLTLVPKPGKPADKKSGYRPITLLNVDVRLLAKVMADRLQVPLDVVISPLQSAFIAGRDITDNIQYHRGLLAYFKHRDPGVWLLLMDLAGAYDNVDWGLLRDSMLALGFRATGHVRWAMMLHRGARGQVKLNGHLSAPFPIASGLLQGSGASPLFWTIALQPLAAYLDSLAAGGRIVTPSVPAAMLTMGPVAGRPVPPMLAYADDLDAAVLDAASAAAVDEGLQLFRAAGGPERSLPKSAAVPVSHGGPAAHGAGPGPLGMRVVGAAEPVRILGVPMAVHAAPGAVEDVAFGRHAAGIRAASVRWMGQGLPLVSRVLVAKQCLASKVVHQLSALVPPTPTLTKIQAALRGFVAGSRDPMEVQPSGKHLHPGQARCAMPKDEGGLAFPVLDHIGHALRAKFVALLFAGRTRPWQALARGCLAHPATGLLHWVLTKPADVRLLPQAAVEWLRPHVDALAALRIRRIVDPAMQSFFSVMAEPLFHNDLLPPTLNAHHGTVLVAAPQRDWRYLRDVYHTLHEGDQPMSLATAAAVQLVMAVLPDAWRAHMLSYPPPPPEWQCACVPGAGGGADVPAFVARRCPAAGADVAVHDGDVFWVDSAGRLLPMLPEGQAPVAGVTITPADVLNYAWEPAAVLPVPVPHGRRAPGAGAQMDLHLLGPWSTVVLDPTLWGWRAGCATVALSGYTVRAAARRLAQLAMADALPDGEAGSASYVPGAGLWPVLWGVRPPIVPAGAAGAAVPRYDTHGIDRLERRWAETLAERQRDADRVDQDAAAGLLPGERDAGAQPLWQLHRDHPLRGDRRRSPDDLAIVWAERRGVAVEWRARARVRRSRSFSGVQRGPVVGALLAGNDPLGAGPAPAPLAVGDGADPAVAPAAPGAAVAAAPAAAAAAPAAPVAVAAPVAAGLQVDVLGVASRAVWRRVWDRGATYAQHAVAWRILHGALMVGAYKLRVAPYLPVEAAYCTCCAAAGRPGRLETLTHAFMECPAVAPVERSAHLAA